MDNEYLHSVLRDSTYILLRYIEQNAGKKFIEIYQQALYDKILNVVCKLLHQLCIKGLDFESSMYLQHIPDIISTLVNYEQHLTLERIKIILIEIYQVIKHSSDPICIFLSYAIGKL